MFCGTEDLRDQEIFLRLIGTVEEQPQKEWVPAYYFDICLTSGERI